MKYPYLILLLLISGIAAAQTDSTMNAQLNRQEQNKTSMNKASGNSQKPGVVNNQDGRKTKAMVRRSNKKVTVQPENEITTGHTVPPSAVNAPQPPENTNQTKPAVTNGNAGSLSAGTKQPEP
jgi:hypothetical protein